MNIMVPVHNRKGMLTYILYLIIFVSAIGLSLNMRAVAAEHTAFSVLAFTSDVHNNGSNNISRDRLNNLIDEIRSNSSFGKIDYMGFCGDMAYVPGVTESVYWDYTKTIVNLMNEKKIRACYTTGNHEFVPGNITATTASWVRSTFTIDEEAVEGKNYRIYCLGTYGFSTNDKYFVEQAEKLESYFDALNAAGDKKPVFVLTHYPLHCFTYTSGINTARLQTENASLIIDALNKGCVGGRIVTLLWGHNHVYADPHYDQIMKPGSLLQFSHAGDNKTINFLYAAAGCMCDQEYDGGSASIKGKALLITVDTINNNHSLHFTYIGAKQGSAEEDRKDEEDSQSAKLADTDSMHETDSVPAIVDPPAIQEVKSVPVNHSVPVVDPDKMKTVTSIRGNTIRLELGDSPQFDNCLVEYRRKGSIAWKTVWFEKTRAIVLKNIKRNGLYQYRFTAFRYIDGTWAKGNTSRTTYLWINKTKIKRCKVNAKELTLTWKQVPKASGYEICFSTDESFKKKVKTITVKSAKVTTKPIKNLKKGKEYYVRMRPIREAGGATYFGIWTKTKRVKVR